MGKHCPDGDQCNFCHFEHDTNKHNVTAKYLAVKKKHVQQVLPAAPPMKDQCHRDSSDVQTPAAWLGSQLQSTELTDSDRSELTHRSDPSELPYGGGGELQDEASWPNRYTCYHETTMDSWCWDSNQLDKADVQSFSI